MDGALRSHRRPGGLDPPSGRRGLPAGRCACPSGGRGGPRVLGLVWPMPAGWPTPFMWCGSGTVASTRSAGGSRTRPSAIGAASAIRCFGSASCCSPAPNASTSRARDGCCSGCASVTLTTSSSAPGWPKSPCGTLPGRHPRRRRVLLDKAIVGCLADDVAEIRSLGKTLRSWRTEILAHNGTGASNGPTEGLNLCVKKVKRCGHGFKTFDHYRLRVLLHAGGVTWPPAPDRHASEPALPTRTRRARLGRPGKWNITGVEERASVCPRPRPCGCLRSCAARVSLGLSWSGS